MSFALPIAPQRRGACPTLDAPMQTGDGLLARIRLAGGRIDPLRLEQLATICGTYGNGVIEITARGNLQVRGLSDAIVARFAREVREVVTVETGPVVETPPLAGDDTLEFVDPRPLAVEIRTLAAPLTARLGPKVTVVVDGDGQIGLQALKADLRLVATARDRWLVFGGVALLGSTERPLDCARIVLTALAALGPAGRATDLPRADIEAALGTLIDPMAPLSLPTSSPIGHFRLRKSAATGLGLPFGAIAWESIAALADGAWRFGISEFRLGPHHSLLAVGADGSPIEEAAQIGFIVDPRDPRTRISACIGSEGCASGHIAARSEAARLAPLLPAGSNLHVSGCAKGCAHPGKADVTLVGRSDGYGLVIGGRASDTPQALLRADQLGAVLASAQG